MSPGGFILSTVIWNVGPQCLRLLMWFYRQSYSLPWACHPAIACCLGFLRELSSTPVLTIDSARERGFLDPLSGQLFFYFSPDFCGCLLAHLLCALTHLPMHTQCVQSLEGPRTVTKLIYFIFMHLYRKPKLRWGISKSPGTTAFSSTGSRCNRQKGTFAPRSLKSDFCCWNHHFSFLDSRWRIKTKQPTPGSKQKHSVSGVMQLIWQWDTSAYINQINVLQYKSPYVRAYFLVRLVSTYYYHI